MAPGFNKTVLVTLIGLTGIHGNMIGHSLAFTVLALVWREHWVVSALSLGVGIGLGMWPVLLAPILAWRAKMLRYLTIAALPSLSLAIHRNAAELLPRRPQWAA